MELKIKLKNDIEFNINFDSVEELIKFVENFVYKEKNNFMSLGDLFTTVAAVTGVNHVAQKFVTFEKENSDSDCDYIEDEEEADYDN